MGVWFTFNERGTCMWLTNVFYLLLVVLLFGGNPAHAQSGKWGLGGFIDYNMPLKSLRDRYDNSAKYGATLNYVTSEALTVEVQYYYSKFDDGKLATDPFVYPVDGNAYTSPNAKSELTLKSLGVNALIFLGEEKFVRPVSRIPRAQQTKVMVLRPKIIVIILLWVVVLITTKL